MPFIQTDRREFAMRHMSRGILRILAPAVATSAGGADAQQQQQVIVQPQRAVAVVEPPAVDIERFSVIHSPEVLWGNRAFDKTLNKTGNGQSVHNVGFKISTLAGWFARYDPQRRSFLALQAWSRGSVLGSQPSST
jgi:hypothetical protein